MTRLVFVTQQLDREHPALAATIPKLEALALLVDEVVVLALGARGEPLPSNCRVELFGGDNRPLRTLRFLRALTRALRGPRPVAVVAHMVPVYALLAAPLVLPRRVPLLLWYTHWRATAALRLANRVVNAIVTVDQRSVPLDSAKVVPIGHGIRLEEFPPRSCSRAEGTFRALALGRYSPAKGYETVVRAVGLALEAGVPVRLRIVGPTLTAEERSHRAALELLCEELGLEESVSLEGSVSRAEVSALLGETDVLVNNMRSGATDKVVFEAAASCIPVLASNPALDELLPEGLRFGRERPDELAARLGELSRFDRDEVERLGRKLRERVAAGHTVESWARGVLAAAARS